MSENRKKFSIGKKIYLFVAITVVIVAAGTAVLSYFINARQLQIKIIANT